MKYYIKGGDTYLQLRASGYHYFVTDKESATFWEDKVETEKTIEIMRNYRKYVMDIQDELEIVEEDYTYLVLGVNFELGYNGSFGSDSKNDIVLFSKMQKHIGIEPDMIFVIKDDKVVEHYIYE